MPISSFDISNIDRIISGELGDWFTADLLRLMAKSDKSNLRKLATVYPLEFAVFCMWKSNGIPTEYGDIFEVRHLVNHSDTMNWLSPEGHKPKLLLITNGRDF